MDSSGSWGWGWPTVTADQKTLGSARNVARE